MRVFKAILSSGTSTEPWILIVRKNYRRRGWSIRGVRIGDGMESDVYDIPASEVFSAIKTWAEQRPGNYSVLTYGEVKLTKGG